MNLFSPPQRPPRRRKTRARRVDRRRQVRLDVPVASAAHAGVRGARDRRSRSGACARGLPHRRLGPGSHRCDDVHRRRRQGDRGQYRSGGGSDRQSGRRHPARPRSDRERQTYRDGQCRGRRAGGTVARGGSAKGRRGLFARLWRPAGADRRDGRLGARDRLSRRRRRQGHQISAGLSRRDAGRRLGPLRPHGRRGAVRRHEPADVQFVSRRHQIRDRNGGDRERDRAGRALGRIVVSAVRRRRPAACDAAARPWRRAGEIRRGGSGVVARARRPAGVPRSALGRLCRAGSAERLMPRIASGNTA